MRGRVLGSILILVVILHSSLPGASSPEELEIYDYHNVPRFDMSYTQLEPSESTTRETTLVNMYNYSMENTSVELEIYRYRTLEESKDPSTLSSPPKISNAGLVYSVELGTIPMYGNSSYSHPVVTTKSTPEGTWLIRTKLEFDINGSHYKMLSRGHFDDDLWKKALSNASVVKNVDGQNISTGGIDLDLLEVDGIVPDTSITVKTPLGLGPFFILAAITAFFGLSALVFYLQEEKGMFPKAEWAYQRIKGKIATTKMRVENKLKKR